MSGPVARHGKGRGEISSGDMIKPIVIFTFLEGENFSGSSPLAPLARA